MKKIYVEEHKRIILEFLKNSFPKKNPALRETGRKHVYKCYNEGGSLGGLLALASEYPELVTGNMPKELYEEVSNKIEAMIPLMFIGRNYITIDKDWQRAVDRLKSINPARDWNMFEIEKYQDYFVVYD